MKKGILLLLIAVQSFGLWAQKKDKLGDYFLLTGQLLEVDPFAESEGRASLTQVVVYQNEEIFVAFDSGSSGKYEFYLPIGYVYTIHYGGSKFLNKRVILDARSTPREKKPRSMNLDIGLFAPIEGAQFPALEQPFVKIAYDKEYDDFVPDFDHTEAMMKQLEKEIKLAKKSRNKKSQPTAAQPSTADKDH